MSITTSPVGDPVVGFASSITPAPPGPSHPPIGRRLNQNGARGVLTTRADGSTASNGYSVTLQVEFLASVIDRTILSHAPASSTTQTQRTTQLNGALTQMRVNTGASAASWVDISSAGLQVGTRYVMRLWGDPMDGDGNTQHYVSFDGGPTITLGNVSFAGAVQNIGMNTARPMENPNMIVYSALFQTGTGPTFAFPIDENLGDASQSVADTNIITWANSDWVGGPPEPEPEDEWNQNNITGHANVTIADKLMVVTSQVGAGNVIATWTGRDVSGQTMTIRFQRDPTISQMTLFQVQTMAGADLGDLVMIGVNNGDWHERIIPLAGNTAWRLNVPTNCSPGSLNMSVRYADSATAQGLFDWLEQEGWSPIWRSHEVYQVNEYVFSWAEVQADEYAMDLPAPLRRDIDQYMGRFPNE